MAKDKGSTKLYGPLYVGGKTNGPVAGPTGGKSPSDPLGYKSATGDKAPGGKPIKE